MTREQRAKVSAFLRYTVLIIVGIIMVYPLIWMVGATFKTNSEIFTSAWFWPKNPVFDGYDNAFKSYEMGMASAQAWLLFLIVMTFTAVAFISQKKWVYYSDEDGR